MSDQSVLCPYCGCPANLVSGLTVYPHLRRLWPRKYWYCQEDAAWVGCHPAAAAGGRGDGTVPLGVLANAGLRTARQDAHAAFDRLWKSRRMRRRDAYTWLANKLGIDIAQTHIGHFDESQCQWVVLFVRAFEQQQRERQELRQ